MSDPAGAPDQRQIALAERLADEAGRVLRQYYRMPVAVADKADNSPVTIADREAEAAMRAILAAEAPGQGVFGEEGGAENEGADWVWVLDPIDGTKAFITGKPSFTILIALLHRGRPVLGLIDQPILGERFLGLAGRPSTLNGRPIRCRACAGLDKAALYATGPEIFPAADGRAFRRLSDAAKMTRFGADGYAYALLALGFVDLVAESTLKPYDYLAHVPVIEGAGGRITDWSGRPLGLSSDGRVLAAGDPGRHAEALTLLGSSETP